MEIKFCITSDIHFERVLLEENGFENMVSYFRKTILYIKPSIFFIAGDLTDSRNLRLETPETAKLTEFVKILLDTCKSVNCELVILKGTPSHDGDIVKNLSFITDKYDNYTYVDEMSRMRIRGIDILFIPEMYRPTYAEFNTELTDKVNPGNPVDLIVFHGMFDFAISVVKQVDSKHNLSRTVVMNSKEVGALCKLAIGGHVHSFMNSDNVYYTGRFINERGHYYNGDTYGIKYVEVTEGKYSIRNVDNPYVIKQEVINIDLVNNEPDSESIRKLCHPFLDNMKDVIFYITVNQLSDTKDRLKKFKDIYKPLYIKRIKQIADEEENVQVEYGTQLEIFSNEDMRNMIAEAYKASYGTELDKEFLDMLELGDDYDA